MARPRLGKEANTNSRLANGNRGREIISGIAAIDRFLAEAKAFSGRSLGDNVRVYNAQTDSGIYQRRNHRRKPHHIVQKLSHSPRSPIPKTC